MENLQNKVKLITGKDEQSAVTVIKQMLDETDVELFKVLINQSDFLLPFIRDNVAKRFEKAINVSNFLHLIDFSSCYSPDYDRVFVNALNVFGDGNVKKKMLSFLSSGTVEQKTYAARYFELSGAFEVVDELLKNAFSENEYLADSCAAALGSIEDEKSYNFAKVKLMSDDDFEALSGLNFFVSYINNPPMTEIFEALNKSGMAENFAGKIAYLTPIPKLIQDDLKNGLIVVDDILSGFGEILPLSEVFNFELYDTLGMFCDMPENDFSSQISTVLLRAKSKFDMISENDEYIFDEDKNTKEEIKAINQLLNSFGDSFWQCRKNAVENELDKGKKRILSALFVIKEFEIKDATSSVLNMIYENTDETIICEGLSVLKILNALSYIDKEEVLLGFKNANLKALAESYYQ